MPAICVSRRSGPNADDSDRNKPGRGRRTHALGPKIVETNLVSTIRDCTTSLGCERDTGYHASTLQYIFDKYAGANYTFQGQLPQRGRQTWMTIVYFYCFFMLMHLGLHIDRRTEWADVTNGRLPGWDGLSDCGPLGMR